MYALKDIMEQLMLTEEEVWDVIENGLMALFCPEGDPTDLMNCFTNQAGLEALKSGMQQTVLN